MKEKEFHLYYYLPCRAIFVTMICIRLFALSLVCLALGVNCQVPLTASNRFKQDFHQPDVAKLKSLFPDPMRDNPEVLGYIMQYTTDSRPNFNVGELLYSYYDLNFLCFDFNQTRILKTQRQSQLILAQHESVLLQDDTIGPEALKIYIVKRRVSLICLFLIHM